MPGLDGTGPKGDGKPGRGFGPCFQDDRGRYQPTNSSTYNRGRRRRRRRGRF